MPDTEIDPDPSTEIASLDKRGNPILTVGQLRTIIADQDDDTHVVMDDTNEWWVNIGSVGVPNADRYPWQALTFIAGIPYDARQH